MLYNHNAIIPLTVPHTQSWILTNEQQISVTNHMPFLTFAFNGFTELLVFGGKNISCTELK